MSGTSMTNTPIILFIIGQTIGLLFFVFQLPRRRKLSCTAAACIIYPIIYIPLAAATDLLPSFCFWPVYVLLFSVGALFLYIVCDIPGINALYFSIRGFLLGEMATSLQWQINDFALNRLNLNGWPALAFAVLIYITVFLIAWLLENRHHEENGCLEIKASNIGAVFLIFFCCISLGNMSFLSIDSPFRASSSADIFSLRTAAYFGGVGMTYMYHAQLLETERRIHAERMYSISQMQYNNYCHDASTIALVEQKYHDLKHQIHWLRNEVDTEQKLQLLDRMEEEIRIYETRMDTGNKVLDAILTSANLTAQDKHIRFHCMIDGHLLEFLDPVEISSLFGNAVDNALEAVSQLEEHDKRIIDITVNQHKKFVQIRISNPYSGNLVCLDGRPQTTKSDRRYHGFGIRSIQTIVQKYNGIMTIHTEHELYELCILFPM